MGGVRGTPPPPADSPPPTRPHGDRAPCGRRWTVGACDPLSAGKGAMPDLAAVPLRTRDPETWAALRRGGLIRRVERGSVLLHEGDASDYVVLIEDGSLKVVAIAENGTEVVLAVRRAGDIVGDFAAVGGPPRSASPGAFE